MSLEDLQSAALWPMLLHLLQYVGEALGLPPPAGLFHLFMAALKVAVDSVLDLILGSAHSGSEILGAFECCHLVFNIIQRCFCLGEFPVRN